MSSCRTLWEFKLQLPFYGIPQNVFSVFGGFQKLQYFGGGGYDTYIQWLVAMFLMQFKYIDVHTWMHVQV